MFIKPVLIALSTDLLIGDPRWLPHPVRWIGRLIELIELWIRKYTYDSLTEKLAGAVTVTLVVGITGVLAFTVEVLLRGIAGETRLSVLPLSDILVGVVGSFAIALRGLSDEASAVIRALKEGNIELSRKRLSMIVGRDTAELDSPSIVRATVETVAENASDGVIAPVFYLFLFGLPGAFIYKAINTLDSMIGYKNERYINFGYFAAKCDDVANYIPARLTGIFITLSAGILRLVYQGLSFRESIKTLVSDGSKHSSPNAGYPEAAMAGALGIRLGGPNYYGGRLVEKPYIGQERKEPEAEDALVSISVVGVAVFLFVIFLLGISWIISW